MGTKTRTNFEDQVKALIKDTHLVSELSKFMDQGLLTYSKRRPRSITVEKTGDGETYAAVPTSNDGWIDCFSMIMNIEFPLDETPPHNMEDDEWIMQQVPTAIAAIGYRIKWINSYPLNGDKYWINFISPHTLTADPAVNTTSDGDFDGICNAMAAVYCEGLARFYLGDTTPSLDADAVDYQSKAKDAQDLADALWKKYDILIPNDGHSEIADWDRTSPLGTPLMTHEEKDSL